MAVTTTTFNRGLYNYNLHLGTDAFGDSVDYLDRVEPDEATGYPVRYFPDSTYIKRDRKAGKGGVEYIETVYIKTLLDAFGYPMHKLNEYIKFRTNHEDILFFIAGLGLPIMKSNNNGFFRSPMGFDDVKIFDSITGTVIPYTQAQTEAAPTYTYYDSDTTNP